VNAAAFIVGLLAIGLLGFANQRGGLCTVQALEDILERRQFGRLFALIEASLWVAGGLVLLEAFGLVHVMPAGFEPSVHTVLGGVLLGVGAVFNGACAFGTIGRIGRGQWAYLAMPIGFFLGCLAMSQWFVPREHAAKSMLFVLPWWVTIGCVVLIAWRLFVHGFAVRRAAPQPLSRHWSPHVATVCVGLAFLVASVALGTWTYTESLIGFARGMSVNGLAHLALIVAVFTGSGVGAWRMGVFRPLAPRVRDVARCTVGGFLMGAGAFAIPGGSDGLVLVGMPMLWSYAWLGFASMCVTVYVALRLGMRVPRG
jgi:toxin CptA